MRGRLARIPVAVCVMGLAACNALYDFEYVSDDPATSSSTGVGGASSSQSSSNAASSTVSASSSSVGQGGAGGAGGMGHGGNGGAGAGMLSPCGNGQLDGGEECDLGLASASWCVDCQVVCPAQGAGVRVGAPDEPHCYVGVDGGSKNAANNDCSALGSGWELLELNSTSEASWLHNNRGAIGISTSKYFWTGAVKTSSSSFGHPNGANYTWQSDCNPPGIWADGEPCDGQIDDCTVVGLATNDLGLNDAPCSGSSYDFEGICEWEP